MIAFVYRPITSIGFVYRLACFTILKQLCGLRNLHKICRAVQSVLKWPKILLRCMDYKNNEGMVYGQA